MDRLTRALTRVGRWFHLWPEEVQLLASADYLRSGGEELRFRYPLGPDSLVIDLGGFEGDFAAEIRARFACKVWVFEPVTAWADKLRARFVGDEKVRVFDFGLSSANQQVEMTLAGSGTGTFATGGSRVPARLRALKEFWEEERPGPVALMKVNIEGGEYDLLEALTDSRWITEIRYLTIQFHIVGRDPVGRSARIQERLARTHRRQWYYPWIWDSYERRP